MEREEEAAALVSQFDSPDYRRSRNAYTAQCAFEYFVSILVSDAFLAKLLKQIGLDDAAVGVIASLVSFSFLFQLFSILLMQRVRNVKRTVLVADTVSQMLFFGVYQHCLRCPACKSLSVFMSVCALMAILCNLACAIEAALDPSAGAALISLRSALIQLAVNSAAAALLAYPFLKYGSRLIDHLQLQKIWYMTLPFSFVLIICNMFIRPLKYETLFVNNVFRSFLFSIFSFLTLWNMLCVIYYQIVMGIRNAALARERIRMLEMQAEQHYLSDGRKPIVMRGVCSQLVDLLMRYGTCQYDAYRSDVNYNVLMRRVEELVNTSIKKRTGVKQLRRDLTRLLDNEIRPDLRYVFMYGAEYTPQEFARSVCQEDEYVALTSFTHHPFGEQFALEVPDNHGRYPFLNLPIDTLTTHIERALRGGHPVCWEGDTSEALFSFERGIARMADERQEVTQETRQRDFERFTTTDDHCMEIVGIARTPKGKKYFICKNSWGTDNPFGGLMYMSENYLRAKTIGVWMTREAFSNPSLSTPNT